MQVDAFFEIKRTNGQYFTELNPFNHKGFKEWADECNIKNQNILEPFAGSNNLIEMLKQLGFCTSFTSYDLEPKSNNVKKRDTLESFPQNFNVCITNPPYLAQNSAKRRGLNSFETNYDDIYKFALSKCLLHCKYVGAIIPASFLNTKLFRDRLSHYILLTDKMFRDTEHPVCLALFSPASQDVKIYESQNYLGCLSDFENKMPSRGKSKELQFNNKTGKLGLFAIDNTVNSSIKFCNGEDINPEKITVSSRSITRILIDADINKLISKLNERLESFREETFDLFLTPFKGLRKDGRYRRRLDFTLARAIINEVCHDYKI
jgi:hypothetical protein